MPPQGLTVTPPSTSGGGMEVRRPPIQGAYTPTPDDPNSRLRKILDFIGGFTGFGGGLTDKNSSNASAWGDAVGQLNPEKMILGPIMGMTKFIKPVVEGGKVVRGVDTARRIAKTEENLAQMEKVLRGAGAAEEDIQTALNVHKRYPRTTAHIDNIGTTNFPQLGNVTINPMDATNVHVNPDLINAGLAGTHLPYAQTLTHELQHVGQMIPNKANFYNRYKDYDRIAGYMDNPFEVAARKGAAKRVPLAPLQQIYGPTVKK